MKRLLIYVLVFSMVSVNVQGQQQPLTFTSNTTLVVIDVSIKDKSGKVIDDLKKGDFTLTEDGKTQQIAVFDFQKLDNTEAPPVPAAKAASISGAHICSNGAAKSRRPDAIPRSSDGAGQQRNRSSAIRTAACWPCCSISAPWR